MFATLVAAATILSDADVQGLMKTVSPRSLRNTVERLSGFTTRNTLSPTCREACEWLAGEYRKIPGMRVEVMRYTLPRGRRVPQEGEAFQVVATLPGKTSRTVLLGAHLDSLNLSVDPATGRAPGANDDASGVALGLEVARSMAQREWNQTIRFAAFTGEEQGLLGSRALAKRAKEGGWNLEAVLSCDTVGSSSNRAGQKDARRVRVFSEEGEGHQSRELARLAEWIVRRDVKGFGVKLVLRRDRFGRGGDHTPFVEQGFSAVRFIEVFEEYTRQHTPDDLPEHMDFGYLANVAKANLAVLASLSDCNPAPSDVKAVRDQSHDTTLTWTATAGVRYVVYWRDTASAAWQGCVDVGPVASARIEKVNKDDHVFAVGAVGGIPVNAD